MLVHYGPARRAELEALCAAAPLPMRVAIDGLTVTITPATPVGVTGSGRPSEAISR